MNVITEHTIPFYIYKIPNFKTHKSKILKLIEDTGTFSYNVDRQRIFNTDWHLPQTFYRPYWEYVSKLLEPYFQELGEQWPGFDIKMQNYWYQQYQNADYHDWHMHPYCNYSSVFYIDLPSKKLNTEFKRDAYIFSISVEEGDILTFPSFLFHRSPLNTTVKTKTVLAFNISLMDK